MSTPSSIKLFGISGSLRAQSYNSGALAVVGSVLPDGMTFDVASLADLPFYNADVEQRGFPAAVESFRRKVAAADALIFADGANAGSFVAAAIVLLVAGAPFGILQHTNRFGAALRFVTGNLIFASPVMYAVTNAGSSVLAPLRSPLLRVCANLSYCMYLIHCILMNGYDGILKKMGLPAASTSFGSLVIRAAVILIVCFTLAEISRKVIELPALRLKRHFSPARPRLVGVTAKVSA